MVLSAPVVISSGSPCKKVAAATAVLWACLCCVTIWRRSRSQNAMWPWGLPDATIGGPSDGERERETLRIHVWVSERETPRLPPVPVLKASELIGPQSCVKLISVSSSRMLWMMIRPVAVPTPTTSTAGLWKVLILNIQSNWQHLFQVAFILTTNSNAASFRLMPDASAVTPVRVSEFVPDLLQNSDPCWPAGKRKQQFTEETRTNGHK